MRIAACCFLVELESSTCPPGRGRVGRVLFFGIAIYNCQNAFAVGAIIRVAHSFLVREIVIIGQAPWYEKASMGMQRYENLVTLHDHDEFFLHAAERPIWSVE